VSEVTSVLSDGTIRRLVQEGRLRIDPWDPSLVQPASVDLRLGTSFRVFHNHRAHAIDLANPPRDLTEQIKISLDESFVIHPGEFALGATQEWVELPDDLVARIEGKSSLGRLGLIVHATAGFVDPGFAGTLTLEITNLTRVPIVLWPGKPIAQLSLMALDRPAEKPYGHPDLGSHYHGQLDATESRYGAPPDGSPPGDGVVSPAVLHAVLIFAQQEAEEPDKTPFYIAGILLVLWALVVATLGIRNERFAAEPRVGRAVMAVSAVLVAATMTTAVLTG
jgi:dCTP deaminase